MKEVTPIYAKDTIKKQKNNCNIYKEFSSIVKSF